VAGRLGLSMLCLQLSIGALNDVVDARWDAGRKPGKPIAEGRVSGAAGLVVWAAALVVGLALSAPSGAATLAVAAAGATCGYAYDVRLSRTALSWLPLAIGLPLLPIHALLGATGQIPPGAPALLPIGVLAGIGLALANGMVDAERDAAAGAPTIVVVVGRGRAWWLHLAALGAAIAVALGLLPATRAPLVGVGLAGGAALLALGAMLSRSPTVATRERGWEAEAIGVAVLGAAWVGALVAG
jgi:4-hydroxybenzoate polyprenyltransferase